MTLRTYLRASTREQTESISVQRETCRAWAEREGASVGAEYVDLGVSGGTAIEERTGLLEALGALEPGDVLLFAKRDRLARSVLISAMVEKICQGAGAQIVSADGAGNGDGPEAELMRNMVSAFAQYERALIRSRTRRALQSLKRRGRRYTGSIPYGWTCYQVGEAWKMKPEPVEQRAITLARGMREDGATYREICAGLAAAGHEPRGVAWYPATVSRMLSYVPPPGCL